MRDRPRIYIAGPYSAGDQAINVRDAIADAETVLEIGGAPFVPHLNHFWHLLFPHKYSFWMSLDEAWLLTCHALYKRPGISPGACHEAEIARAVGMPVFFDLGHLEEWISNYSLTEGKADERNAAANENGKGH